MSRYNPVTDSYDIYFDGALVGSLPCHFKWDGWIFKNGEISTDIIGSLNYIDTFSGANKDGYTSCTIGNTISMETVQAHWSNGTMRVICYCTTPIDLSSIAFRYVNLKYSFKIVDNNGRPYGFRIGFNNSVDDFSNPTYLSDRFMGISLKVDISGLKALGAAYPCIVMENVNSGGNVRNMVTGIVEQWYLSDD